MNFIETFVENLASLKKANKLTNIKLAEIAGVTPTAIGDILKGKTDEPKLSIIIKIASFYKVSLDWLLLGTQKTTLNNNNDIPKFYTQSEKNEVKGNKNISTFGEDSPIYMSKDDIIQSLQFTIKTMNELLKARENEIEQLKKELEVNKLI